MDSAGKKAGKGALIQTELSATLGVAQDQYLFQPVGLHGDISPTLDASYYKGCGMRQGVERELVFEPICMATQQGGAEIMTDKSPTVTAAAGMSGNNQPVVCYSFDALSSNSMKSSNPHSGCREVDVAKTLDTTNQNPSKNQGGVAIVQTYDARGNGDGEIVSTITGDHNGHISDYTSLVVEKEVLGVDVYNISLTGDKGRCLNTSSGGLNEHIPVVIYNDVIPLEGNGSRPSHRGKGWNESDKMFSLNTTEVHAVAYGVDCRNLTINDEQYPTLQAKPNGGQSLNYSGAVLHEVECLTPAYATGNGQSQNMRLSTQVGTLDCMHDQKIVLQPCYWDGSQTTGTLTANNAGGNQRMPDKENFNCILDVFSRQRTDEYKENDTASTLSARDYKSATDLIVLKENDNG